MGKIAKKGNKSLFKVVDRIKELLRVDRHVTEKLTTRIEQYEEKQAKKERKRLAKHNKQP